VTYFSKKRIWGETSVDESTTVSYITKIMQTWAYIIRPICFAFWVSLCSTGLTIAHASGDALSDSLRTS